MTFLLYVSIFATGACFTMMMVEIAEKAYRSAFGSLLFVLAGITGTIIQLL